jgi:hypothetical protein
MLPEAQSVMHSRVFLIVCCLFALLLFIGQPTRSQAQQTDDEVRQAFMRSAAAKPDNCDGPWSDSTDEEKIEHTTLQTAEDRAIGALNARAVKPEQAKAIITQTLQPLEKMGEIAEAAWPKENRWHFEVVEMLLAVVIKFSYRTQEHIRVLGIAQGTDKTKPPQWKHLGEEHWDDYGDTSWSKLSLLPLHRGPSGAVRFLVFMSGGGCAGSWGEKYGVEEWHPAQDEDMSEVLSQTGSVGLSDSPVQNPTKKVPFPLASRLKTDGTRLTLPYCEFTQLDTWDNPSLCMADTYDISGDEIRFLDRRYNRPDLAPVAKALAYAKSHDLPALRAYCISDAVARQVLDNGYGFEYMLETIPLGKGRERVRSYGDGRSGFVVEKRGRRWLIASFKPSSP